MRRSLGYALWLCAGMPTLLAGQGFGIFEQGACAMGRGGTGVALPCPDGTAMFFNPAGLAGLTGKHATVCVTLIDVQGGFTDDIFQRQTNLNDPLIPVPQLYISYGPTSKLGLGIGLFVPYGLETQWPLSFDGRFSGFKNILRSVYIQPTLAYQVTPWLSLGGGVDIVLGSAELNQRVDLADAPVPLPGVPPGMTFSQFGIAHGTDFASAHLEATKTTVAGHVGARIQVNNQLSFGANFLTLARLDYSGTASFTQVPTGLIIPTNLPVGALTIPAGCPVDALLSAPATACGGVGFDLFNATGGVFRTQPTTTTLKNPAELTLGVAYKVANGWTLLGDYQLTFWNQFTQLVLTFPQDASGVLNRTLYQNYQNTNGFRFGAEWVRDATWTFRGGYVRHDGAAPAETVTPLLPEGQRNTFSAGTTVKLSPGLSADLAYQYVRQNDRRGRTREPTFNQVPTTGLNNGLYTLHAHLFAVSLSYAY